MNKLSKIGVLTSGGDAPGMNAAVRAVVRKCVYENIKVTGIIKGYQGLVNGDFLPLNAGSVSGILKDGGTMLKSARCPEFRTPEGRATAYENFKKQKLDGLVVIGGDGTFTGANIFGREYNIPIIGVPGTIDNDLFGTDLTIGYDTALNTVVDAVDKIRDTATAHSRLFFIEVMGRDAGFIALNAGVASGAEVVLLPEKKTSYDDLKRFLEKQYSYSKDSSIVLVAEGKKMGNTFEIAQRVNEEHPEYDARVTILGHLQRGGSPTVADRVLASELGVAAVEALIDDQKSIMVGMVDGEIVHVPFNQALKNKKGINERLFNLINVLSGGKK
ncbi:6-phosphofructokinase [Carboxylicivirga linearis]|uniref:ATP-dependent 6-phosphofructokinase n=1 Tax=Carboxylicivirga linearis TaxID=1628157 RepID=A0ABS5JV31_9BACT|nr:6-phosphofructokinase [Carboxylicivirga linearis]MBS2098334.1 6-phosphofructokinase [Carboxylicivirga linearis]